MFRSLTGRNETVRLRVVSSIDPKRQLQALPDLIEAAKHNSSNLEPSALVPNSTVALLYLIAEFEHISAEQALVELLDSPHAGIVMISADALGKNKKYGAIEALSDLAKRPAFGESYGFRFNLVRAMAQMEHPDAVEYLTELRSKIDGQLAHNVQELLEGVTEDHFFGDKERFKEWRQQRESKDDAEREAADPKVNFFTASDSPDSMNRIKFERPQYYGIDIHAKRLMFIIDHSGSMKEYWGAYTRLDRAKFELVRAIEELPEDTEFAITFYESGVRVWRNELVQATRENKREAIKFVQRLGYGDKTNTYGALRQSMEFDDDLESVFLLTDGRPTTGNIIAPAAIVKDVIRRNRFRHLNINTIGVAVKGTTETFLRTLAEETNGEFRSAEWE